ncbi:MAG: phosphoribosyltransferase family protein [Bacteroidia bacterium]|jgi:pyrimidine operon attenuation protein/uracil phosphoribosyltransferase
MRKQILSNLNLPTTQRRMAVELLELLNPNQPVFLLGIEKNGSPLALQLKTHLHEQQPSLRIHIASVRLNKSNPESEAVHALQDLDFMGCQVVVVDDVLNTGRTAMAVIAAAALKVPAAIRLLVLVDRMHKAFPISADIAGARISTLKGQFVQVEMQQGQPLVFLEG